MELLAADFPEQTALPDPGETPLLVLLHSDDPTLVAGLSHLTTLVHSPSTVTSGWTSAIDVE